MNDKQIEQIVAAVLQELGKPEPASSKPVLSEVEPPLPLSEPTSAGETPVEPSARHVHLTHEALEKLFGKGAALTQKRALSQPGEFLSEQRVNLVTAKGLIENVAVLGPVRGAVQAELSRTDCHALGINAPIRRSGDLRGGADVLLVGPAGIYEAAGAAIVAQAHIHMTPNDAERFGVQNGQAVAVRTQTARPVTFEQVIVRVNPNFALAMHIDFDEANACALEPGSTAAICSAGTACIEPKPAAEAAAEAAAEHKIITEAIAKELIKTHTNSITLRRGTILTPSARDVFSDAHVSIELIN